MNRRELILKSTALGLAPFATAASRTAAAAPETGPTPPTRAGLAQGPKGLPLRAPADGSIPVAFLISDGAVVIDFSGPWEVFESTSIIGRKDAPFQLFTVAESPKPITASGGLTIKPNHTFKTAPTPRVVVIPAQQDASEAALEWIRQVTSRTDVTMSVCTGARILAATGLLNGKSATTHHNWYSDFAVEFPAVRLIRGARFVEDGNLASSGGLSSGIDLSLRVVERYFGRDVALHTAYYMEYQGQGWLDPDSNRAYRVRRAATDYSTVCAVCDMDIDPATAPQSSYRGKTYYFCMQAHKQRFDKEPEQFLESSDS